MMRNQSLLWAIGVRIVVVTLTVTISGCLGYVPGRQTYWDSEVRDMCAKDGGFTVYEKVRISRADVERGVLPRNWPSGQIGKVDPIIGFAPKALARPDAPIYAVDEGNTIIRDWNPRVIRTQERVERRDGVVVARYVLYTRSGGDVPSPSHPSSYTCPDIHPMFQELSKQLIVVE